MKDDEYEDTFYILNFLLYDVDEEDYVSYIYDQRFFKWLLAFAFKTGVLENLYSEDDYKPGRTIESISLKTDWDLKEMGENED